MTSRADLATQQRLNSMVTLAAFGTFVAYGAVCAVGNPPPLYLVLIGIAVIALVLLGARWARVGLLRRRARFRDLLVGEGRFVAPGTSTPGWNALAGPAFSCSYLGIGEIHHHRLLAVGLLATGIAPGALAAIVGFRVGPRSVILTPDEVGVRTLYSRRWIKWDRIHHCFIQNRTVGLDTSTSRDLKFWSELVDAEFLVMVIDFYRTNPDARAAIGTAAELDRLRTLEFPSTPRSAKTAL